MRRQPKASGNLRPEAGPGYDPVYLDSYPQCDLHHLHGQSFGR